MQEEFSDNREDLTSQDAKGQQTAKDAFNQNKQDMDAQAKEPPNLKEQFNANKAATGQQPQQSVKEKFSENMKDEGLTDKEKEKERKRQEFRKQMNEMDERKQRDKNKGMDMG